MCVNLHQTHQNLCLNTSKDFWLAITRMIWAFYLGGFISEVLLEKINFNLERGWNKQQIMQFRPWNGWSYGEWCTITIYVQRKFWYELHEKPLLNIKSFSIWFWCAEYYQQSVSSSISLKFLAHLLSPQEGEKSKTKVWCLYWSSKYICISNLKL